MDTCERGASATANDSPGRARIATFPSWPQRATSYTRASIFSSTPPTTGKRCLFPSDRHLLGVEGEQGRDGGRVGEGVLVGPGHVFDDLIGVNEREIRRIAFVRTNRPPRTRAKELHLHVRAWEVDADRQLR